MLKGIHLTLMIGPAVPVPQTVLAALTSVEVTTSTRGASGFKLAFTLSNRSPLHTLFLLSGGAAIPIMRVIIVVTVNGAAEVLMDGVITNQQVSPGTDPGHSTLTVMGEDLTTIMGLIDFSGLPYPAMPSAARVALILAKYAVLGIVPAVIPAFISDLPIPVERIPQHQGTDLAYIRQLAEEAGYVFYINPGPQPGMNIAYWGPEVKVGVPQPALNVNMDAHTNVEALSFTYDKTKKELPVVYIQNQLTKAPIPLPIPDITPLNPPLGLIPPIPPQLSRLKYTAKLSPLQAVLHGVARAAQSADAVTGTGSLDVLRYGRLLKARQLVGVRGVGMAYDGRASASKLCGVIFARVCHPSSADGGSARGGLFVDGVGHVGGRDGCRNCIAF